MNKNTLSLIVNLVRKFISWLVLPLYILALVILFVPIASAQSSVQPKLILQITVDALRGDLPIRYSPRTW